MTILYLYRNEPDSFDTLKFSLRSLKYIEVDRILVVGDAVDADVENIVLSRHPDKFYDVNWSFEIGLNNLRPREDTLLMHDDMYLLPRYKPFKRQLMSPYPQSGERSEIQHDFTLWNYSGHYPMPFYPEDLPNELPEKPYSIMQFLGRYSQIASVYADRCKFKYPTLEIVKDLPCFSTYGETDHILPLMQTLYP